MQTFYLLKCTNIWLTSWILGQYSFLILVLFLCIEYIFATSNKNKICFILKIKSFNLVEKQTNEHTLQFYQTTNWPFFLSFFYQSLLFVFAIITFAWRRQERNLLILHCAKKFIDAIIDSYCDFITLFLHLIQEKISFYSFSNS